MKPYIDDGDFRLYVGDVRDVLAELPDGSVDCCVTSPPYWGLRDYGHDGQIGLESSPEAYVAAMVAVFREVRRALTDTGTCWLNLGDSYNSLASNQRNDLIGGWDAGMGRATTLARGLKVKDLVGIPWRVAFALQADGWYLRSDIIWSKPNPMPESVTDRPTKSHEYVFLLSKGPRYFFDQEAVREAADPDSFRSERGPGTGAAKHAALGKMAATTPIGRTCGVHESGKRNIRTVWTIGTQPYAEAHFATFPEALPERCIKAGCPEGGTVLDPFMGSGTTALVARRLGRKSVGIELNAEYARLAARRLQQLSLLAEDVA